MDFFICTAPWHINNLDLDTIEKYNILVYRMDTDIMLSKECESLYGELKVENLELQSKINNLEAEIELLKSLIPKS